jgi:hypothetical protein
LDFGYNITLGHQGPYGERLINWESDFPWQGFPASVEWNTHGLRRGLGGGDSLEIIWGIGGSHSVADLRSVWEARSNNGRRNNPVVAVHMATANGPAILVGPGRVETTPPVIEVSEIGRLTRLLEGALEKENRFRAREHLERYLPGLNDPAWGVRNRGLFATHSLLNTPRFYDDWAGLSSSGQSLLNHRDSALAERLGYEVVPGPGGRYSILSVDGEAAALGLFLPADEGPQSHVARFGSSPVLYAFRIADEENLPWIIINAGDRLQLYSTSPEIGVGRRGRTETYTEILLDLIAPNDSGYIPLLFSSDALRPGGYLQDLIRRSSELVSDLSARLRDRIYNDVLPILATGIAQSRQLELRTINELETTQNMALSVLFRMLFISYAEDRDLLPYTESESYQMHSLKRLAVQWAENTPQFEENSYSLWRRLMRLTRAIYVGDEELQIPAYGGTPFSSDGDISVVGNMLESIELNDSTFGPAIMALIMDSSEEGFGPIDFRELSVREFGTIYEGLLESKLSYAEEDLTTDRKGFYYTATEGDEIVIEAGNFYLSNGGKRKSSASYYTKEFAVEHLLDCALEPALNDHLNRVDSLGSDHEKSEALFDFMIADISMGSGHFLVAAIDRIERRFSSYLDKNPLDGIRTELNRLWNIAAENLQKDVNETGINQPMLLRRQIARRCIYGVDLNPVAVDLARVSVWIHTFVPGLPLSFLDWHLRQGNSIIGVSTQQEVWSLLDQKRQSTLFASFKFDARERMNEIMKMMIEISNSSDSSLQEVEDARETYRQTFIHLQPWEALMDTITASRFDAQIRNDLQLVLDRWGDNPSSILEMDQCIRSRDILAGLDVFHHQAMFPEVMWRENPGFDVILGNPPWEKLHVESHSWWSIFSPGIARGTSSRADRETAIEQLSQSRPDLNQEFNRLRNENERIRGYLRNCSIPGIGNSHIDLYQVFSWKFWDLLRTGGRIGVVLPRGVFNGKAMESWRSKVLDEGYIENLQFLTNNGGWVFSDVHNSYSIALSVINKTVGELSLFCGPHCSLVEFQRNKHSLAEISNVDLRDWNAGLSFPYLPNEESGEIMRVFNLSDKFGDIQPARFRFLQGDMNATANRDQFNLEKVEETDIPVLKGSSVGLWNWQSGEPYGWANTRDLATFLLDRYETARSRSGSAFESIEIQSISQHPISIPRIAFKDVTSPTNTRSAIFCMIPQNVATVHTTPLMIRQNNVDEFDEAIHIAILNSRIFDWYVRRYVELHLTFTLLNQVPFPNYDTTSEMCQTLVGAVRRLHMEDPHLIEWCNAIVNHDLLVEIPNNQIELFSLIDAIVAILYGLDKNQIRVIMSTFHRTWDYETYLDLVLGFYDTWSD